MNSHAGNGGSRAVLLAVFAYAAAVTACNLIPHTVLPFSTVQRLDEAQIGFLAMCEAMALAFASMSGSALSLGLARLAGIGGPVLVALAQLASIVAPGFLTLVVLRTLVGAGCGLASALAVRVISQSSQAGPAFGWANGVSSVTSATLLAAVPRLPSDSPAIRVFVTLALLAAVLAVLVRGATRELGAGPAAAAPAPAAATRIALGASGLALMLATLLIYLPLGGLFTFSVQQGIRIGMSEAETGGLLGWVLLAGFGGGWLAAWTDARLRAVACVALGSALSVIACIAVGTAGNPWAFGSAFLVYAIAYQYAISILQAASSRVDPSGRLPAVLFGVMLIGYALGSYLTGYLLTIGQPSWMWQLGAVGCAAAAAPAILVVRRRAPG